jgi:uncharacterized protein YjiS (DUF1127 family)
MKRLTANEIETLRSERPMSISSDQVQDLVQEARRLQAQFLRQSVVSLSGKFADLTGLNLLISKIRRANSRRKTLSALSALSDRNLADIGLHRSGIEAKAIETSETQVPAVNGLWNRIARRAREERDRRRTVRDLLAMEDRLLADIGFERSQVWDYADAMTRKPSLIERAVAGIAAPVALLAEEFETLFTRTLGYDKRGWMGKTPANDRSVDHGKRAA